MIQLKKYSINNIPLTNDILTIYIDKFWSEVFEENSENHLFLLSRIKFTGTEQGFRTLGHLVKVNYEDKELFISYLSERLTILNDSYVTLPISQISYSYIIKKGKCLDDNRTLLLQDYRDSNLTTHNFNNMNLPITMDPFKYGQVLVSNIIDDGYLVYERFIVLSGNKTYQIDVYDGGKSNKVKILGNINLEWVDSRLDEENSDYFKRDIKKSSIYFLDGEIILRKKEIHSKPFLKLQKESAISTKFFTLDIETVTQNKKVTPYLINAYDGRHYINSYNNDQNILFSEFITKLLSILDKGSKTYIYAHNLSTFDGVLMLKHLFKFGKVEPIIHNGKLISIKLTIKEDNKTIIFKDSFLLLPHSLRNLCKAFNIDVPKGYFPFNLNEINYTGVFPNYEYWTDISNSEWNDLKKSHGKIIWNFKDEAIKYCKLDCKSLHEILTKFNELIYSKFNINIHKSLTLPSLAMRIFKIHFMPANSIYQILGKTEFDIRESYTGGSVDVYIPSNRTTPFFGNYRPMHRLLYSYDVNNLYPTVMANAPMPIGKPVAFEGDIIKVEPEAFGFFYCKISTTKYLEHPILQRRIKTENGMRSIAGLGSWTGWIFSEEMYNAQKYGYQFEILKGYQFEKGYIFKKYVETLYNLRLEYPKTNPMNLIIKLLLNSLYGKFGMKLETTDILVFNTSNPIDQKLYNKTFELWAESIKDLISIDEYKILVRNSLISYKYDEELDLYYGQDVNIALASAITANARIVMSYFKNRSNFKLYYSDTDNIVIDKPLPEELIGKNLGQLKLEYLIKRAVFLAPKVYGLVDIDGNTIIKIKGVTYKTIENITIDMLEKLLIENSELEFKQFKWFKKVLDGNIKIEEVLYKLKITSNKREALYKNEDGINIYKSTKPFYYDEITSK